MRRLAIVPLLAVVATAFALSGCTAASTDNGAEFTGPRKSVAEAVDDIVRHVRRREPRKICDGFMSSALKAKLATLAKRSGRGIDCADQLEKSLRDVDAFDLEVRSIRITGREAVVSVRAKTSEENDPVGTLRMVNERGWRIATLP